MKKIVNLLGTGQKYHPTISVHETIQTSKQNNRFMWEKLYNQMKKKMNKGTNK